MSNLSGADKACLETLFGMNSGYVLNFSDSSFQHFFNSYSIDIHSADFQIYGTSKANKLRAFWEKEPDDLVGRVIFHLLKYCEISFFPEVLERHSLALKEGHAIVSRLLQNSNEVPFPTEESIPIGESELPIIPQLPLDPKVSSLIQDRLEEAHRCRSVGADLASLVLCGSVLEAVLLGVAQSDPQKFNRSKSSPKDGERRVRNFRDWSFSELIDVAHDIGLLKLDTLRFSHELRNFRNYIHPEQQLKEDFSPDKHTSRICFFVLEKALDDLANELSEEIEL